MTVKEMDELMALSLLDCAQILAIEDHPEGTTFITARICAEIEDINRKLDALKKAVEQSQRDVLKTLELVK